MKSKPQKDLQKTNENFKRNYPSPTSSPPKKKVKIDESKNKNN
jgi:hypothetical protein